jgi:hypothetical protein
MLTKKSRCPQGIAGIRTLLNFGTQEAGRHLGLWKDETLYWTEKKQYVKIVIIMGICAH